MSNNINTDAVETSISEDVQLKCAQAMACVQEIVTDVVTFSTSSAQHLVKRQASVWSASKKRADDIWSRI